MTAKFIGQFLLEKGLITRDALIEASEQQLRSNLTLGALAVSKGLLTEEQADAINKEQQRTDKRFGEIAISRFLLNERQIDDLLQAQKKQRVFLGEILIKQGHISRDKFEAELVLFKKEQEKSAELVKVDLHSLPQHAVIEDFLDMTLKILLRVAKEQVKITSVSHSALQCPYTFAQQVKGDQQFDYVLALPANMVLLLCQHFLRINCTEVNELALDAMNEVLNIISGNGCAKLSSRGMKVTLEPPRTISSAAPANAICIGMSSIEADFEVRFYF
jgi:CheY-specific phosphatase CheX